MEEQMATQGRGEETRSRILQAALDCFAQHGYDNTSVAQICQAADVTKGGFYYHFTSKHALFLELLQLWLERLDTHIFAACAGSDSVPDALMQMADVARQVSQAAGEQFPMFLEFWTQAARDPATWEATIAPYQRYQTFFEDLIQTGIEAGALRDISAPIAARVLVSLAVGLVLQGVLNPEGADWGEIAVAGVRMLLQAWGSPSRSNQSPEGEIE
jgi:AcrR family transcriptional regulator